MHEPRLICAISNPTSVCASSNRVARIAERRRNLRDSGDTYVLPSTPRPTKAGLGGGYTTGATAPLCAGTYPPSPSRKPQSAKPCRASPLFELSQAMANDWQTFARAVEEESPPVPADR